MKLAHAPLGIAAVLLASQGLAQDARRDRPPPNATGINCRDFRHNADGTWSPLRAVTIVGPHGPFTVAPGQVFWIQVQGTTNYGVNIAMILDSRCL